MDSINIEALKQGDYKVFNKVFEIFWDKVYFYLVKKTKDTEAAKDLTQMVFIKVWKYRQTLSGEIALNEQVFRKTKQVFIDWLRQEIRRRERIAQAVNLSEVVASENKENQVEIKNDVFTALSALPPKRKEIFELKYIYGYSYKEIAEVLGISAKTVDSQLLKANMQLRKALQASITIAVLSVSAY